MMDDTKKICIACEEEDPKHLCPQSKRECGHHCNHWWTHDECCWCSEEVPIEEDEK